MGAWYTFSCSCSYRATVSGQNDVGMAVATSTVICYDCKKLYDVVTTEEPWLAMERDWSPEKLKCPKKSSHKVKKWDHPGPCPLCGETLTRDIDSEVLWD